jgi:hypothetical protein
VVPTVPLKTAKAKAWLMDVAARVADRTIAGMVRVMARVAVTATVGVARNMAGAAVTVMIRADRVMGAITRIMNRADGPTAEARVVRVMAVGKDRVVARDGDTVVADKVRVWVTARAAVMILARADRATDVADRTMARVARAMAVDVTRVRDTARGNPLSTVTVTAVVAIWDTASEWTVSAALSCGNRFNSISRTATAMVAVFY